MSSTVFTSEDSSSVQTRRIPMRTAELENNAQPTHNRRSLSGKFRNLFRKSSASPSRSATNSEVRQTSPSPTRTRTAVEAPHLRAPLIKWPFGKKKTASTNPTAQDKPKRKNKRNNVPPLEISPPIYQQDQQSSIHGQNFVLRTPEATHNSVGRTHSPPSYDNTKGFRDYIIIDQTQSSQQVYPSNSDIVTPPPYTMNRSRSPSLHQQTLTETNIDRSYHHDTTTAISDIEIIPKPRQQYYGEQSPITSTRTLVETNPLFHSTITQPMTTSNSSLNHTEIRSTTSSSMDVDIPKYKAPIIPATKTDSHSSHNDTYYSTSTVNKLVQSNSINPNPYTSLPTIPSETHGRLSPVKSTSSNVNPYPTLSAIVQYHMQSMGSNQSNQNSLSSRKKTPRFDTSTETISNYDQQQQQQQPWSRVQIHSSSSSIPTHDGFIRPLTPPQDRITQQNSGEQPVIYRSSTIIYTRDRQSYPDGGELRTWNAQNNNHPTKPSTSIQILPARIINEFQYQIGNPEIQNLNSASEQQRLQAQYTLHRYPDSRNTSQTHHHRFASNDEREPISNHHHHRHYHTQDSLNSITPTKQPAVTLRHYTLQRTDSYDGLGILLSADADTRLNHRIRDVERDSPGSRAGLRANDRIINVNGVNVEQTDFNDVLLLIKEGLTNNNLQFSVRNEP